MTAEEKLRNLESQIVLIERGQHDVISCPYCGGITPKGGAFCCKTVSEAIAAILDRMDLEQKIREAEAIAEKIEKERPLVYLQ